MKNALKDSHYLLKAEAKAVKMLERPQLISRLVRRVSLRAEKYGPRLEQAMEELKTLGRLAKAWADGRYRKIPVTTLVAVLGALIYFLMPLDSIPDFIFALGFMDDIAVIAKVFQLCKRDLHDFQEWEQTENLTSSNDAVESATLDE